MHVLPLPKNFPEPQSMQQSPVPTWIRWIREESERIVGDLEEEIKGEMTRTTHLMVQPVVSLILWNMIQEHHSFRYRNRRNLFSISEKQKIRSYHCQTLM